MKRRLAAVCMIASLHLPAIDAQQQRVYGFVNHGEGTFIAISIDVGAWKPIKLDSLRVASSDELDFIDNLPDGPKSGKKIFNRYIGVPLAFKEFRVVGDSVFFRSAEYYYDQDDPSLGHRVLNFRGKKVGRGFEGELAVEHVNELGRDTGVRTTRISLRSN